MAGWTNWNDATDKGKGKLLKKTLNELRGAMLERTFGDTTGVPPAVVTGELDFAQWLSDFQTKMTALIPNFINTSYAGGVPFYSLWNETTITAETEEGSRLSVPTDPQLGRAWYWQQKEMLNLMVWQEIPIDDYPAGRYSTDGGSSWTNDGTINYASIENSSGSVAQPTLIEDCKVEFTADSNYKHETSIYIYSETLSTYYALSPYVTEGGYNLAVTMPEQTLGATVTTDFLIDGYTTIPATMPANTSNFLEYNFQGFLIAKFDSANGFEFQ